MKKNTSIFIQNYSSDLVIKKFYCNQRETYKLSNDCFISILLISSNKIITNVLITGDIIWFSEKCVKKN